MSDAIYEIFAPIEATAFTEDEWMDGNSIIADIAQNGEIIYSA